MLFRLAVKSLLNRKSSVLLTLVALVISTALLLSVEHIRIQAKDSFQRTVAGVDLVVAGRSSQINVLLSSVFGLGGNANTVAWSTYQEWQDDSRVKWTIPLSLGDSHKGFAVVGTENLYFEHYKYAKQQDLLFADGAKFKYAYDLVVGADVARQLNYRIGQQVTLSHGLGSVSFSHHHDFPFTISGILKKTGTPVDRSLYVLLGALESIHATPHTSGLSRPSEGNRSSSFSRPQHDEQHKHAHEPLDEHALDSEHKHKAKNSATDEHDAGVTKVPTSELTAPTNISSFMLGLNSRIAVLTMQRDINQYKPEALSAIIPGVALAELWKLLGSVESILLLVTGLMLISSLFGLATMMLATMRERLGEFKVLRIMGAKPRFIFILIQLEVLALSVLSQLIALSLVTFCLWFGGEWLTAEFSIAIDYWIVSQNIIILLGLINVVALLLGLFPAVQAYRQSNVAFA